MLKKIFTEFGCYSIIEDNYFNNNIKIQYQITSNIFKYYPLMKVAHNAVWKHDLLRQIL